MIDGISGSAIAQFRSPNRFVSVMENIHAQRRANVRMLVESWGAAELAKELLFKSRTRISHLLGPKKKMGEIAARYIEWRLGLPVHWMDGHHSVPAKECVSPMFRVELAARDVERIVVTPSAQPHEPGVAEQREEWDDEQANLPIGGVHAIEVYSDSPS